MSSTATSDASLGALRTFALQRLHLCNARGVAKTVLWNPMVNSPTAHRVKPLFRDDLIIDLPQHLFPPKSRRTPLLPASPHRVPPPWLSSASSTDHPVPPTPASTLGTPHAPDEDLSMNAPVSRLSSILGMTSSAADAPVTLSGVT